jgi:hypothetical protein
MSMEAVSSLPGTAGSVPDMATAVRDAIASGRSHLSFRFAFGEIPVTGTLAPETNGYGLSVTASVGVIPYSVEDPSARKALRVAIASMPGSDKGRVGIDRQQTVFIEGARNIASPMTAVSVIASLVALMVELRPLFDEVAAYLPDVASALPPRHA